MVLGGVISSLVSSRSVSITGDDVHVDVDVDVSVLVLVFVFVFVFVALTVAADADADADREESTSNPVVEWNVFETEVCTVAVASDVNVGFVFKLLSGSDSLLILGMLAKGYLLIPLASKVALAGLSKSTLQ